MFKTLSLLFAGAALIGANAIAHAQTASAQTASAMPPIVIYNDGLSEGWQSQSWASVAMQVQAGSVQPIKIEGGPWSALWLHHEPIYTKGYSKITFYINGGVDGGQNLAVKVSINGKILDKADMIQPKTKAWDPVTIPLKDIGGQDVNIDGIVIQGQADAYKPYYVDRIQIE